MIPRMSQSETAAEFTLKAVVTGVVLGIVAVEAGEDVRVERDHARFRGGRSRAAASKSDSLRAPLPPRVGLILIIP